MADRERNAQGIREGFRLAAVWVVLALIFELAAHHWVVHDPYYRVQSEQGLVSVHAFDIIVYLSTALLAFVVSFLGFSVVRFRRRAGQEPVSNVQYQRSPWFQRIWMVLKIAIVLGVFMNPDLTGMEKLWAYGLPPWNHGAVVVDVQARQWQWRFGYPQYGLPMDTKTNGRDVLVVPEGKPIKFVMTSLDVTHSFYVPAWSVKMDIIPGETRTMYITPTTTGSTASDPMLRVQCAQLCGAGHAYMSAFVKVVTPQQFRTWVAQQQQALTASHT
ncbi:MAG: cytochrome c oxidase subunit II [Thermaerobacter sp.]|nr:cytochrome c oxidase subunit II [Thermaerobacter sp.]